MFPNHENFKQYPYPPPLDPLRTWWMPTLNPLQNTIPNPHKTDPTGESMELKARCHSSPFTKAFIVELKVMMSSLEPLEIDPNRPFLPSWKWKNTPPKRKEKGPIFHFHELWEVSFDTMFFFFGGKGCVLLGDWIKMVYSSSKTGNRSHIPPKGKFGKSWTQKGRLVTCPRRVLILLLEEILHQLIW